MVSIRKSSRRWLSFGLALAVLLVAGGIARRLRADLPLETLQQRWANGASKFLELDGMDVHYRDEGAGPAIVLLHGTSASLHTWDGWAAHLAADHRVVRFDLPAFGLTGPNRSRDYSIAAYVAFVERMVESLDVDRFVLAGNSLGGRIAWQYALEHPDRLRGLILVDAVGYPIQARDPPLAFVIARLPLLPRLLVALDPSPLVDEGLRKSYGDAARIAPGVLERYVELSLRPGNRAAFIDRMQAGFDDASDRIASIRTPTLVLWGALDRLLDPGDARRFASDIAGARVVVYPELGHIPMEEDPQRTVRDAESFSRGLAP
jgi:pimeloyl-ACP methyl ester carboxylesterase